MTTSKHSSYIRPAARPDTDYPRPSCRPSICSIWRYIAADALSVHTPVSSADTFQVLYGDNADQVPANALQEFLRTSNDINYQFGGR